MKITIIKKKDGKEIFQCVMGKEELDTIYSMAKEVKLRLPKFTIETLSLHDRLRNIIINIDKAKQEYNG